MKTVAREHHIPEDNQDRYGKPGYRFTLVQRGGASRRRYYAVFKIGDDMKPVWVGGVKATKFTQYRAAMIDWSIREVPIATSTINRIKRVVSEIAANITATSPGPWYMSHGHVISPGKPSKLKLYNNDFDVCATPSGKDHTVYGKNQASDYGRGDMRYIATCEPTRMKKLTEDIGELLAERDDVTALCRRLDDLINNTIGGDEDPRAKALGEAVEAYLTGIA